MVGSIENFLIFCVKFEVVDFSRNQRAWSPLSVLPKVKTADLFLPRILPYHFVLFLQASPTSGFVVFSYQKLSSCKTYFIAFLGDVLMDYLRG